MSAITPDGPDTRERTSVSNPRYSWVISVAILASTLALALFFVVSAWQEEQAPVGTALVAADGPAVSVPVDVIEGWRGSVLVFASIYIDGEGPYSFAIDTGASRTIISHDLVRELRLTRSGNSGQVTGVTGTTDANLIDIERWSVEGVQLPATTAMSLELPKVETSPPLSGISESSSLPQMHGLLGSDVLSAFGTMMIDYENQVLLLRPENPLIADES